MNYFDKLEKVLLEFPELIKFIEESYCNDPRYFGEHLYYINIKLDKKLKIKCKMANSDNLVSDNLVPEYKGKDLFNRIAKHIFECNLSCFESKFYEGTISDIPR